MRKTRVVNIRDFVKSEGLYVYCGRTREKFHYGTPFPLMTSTGSRRDWACDMFDLWLYGDPQFVEMEAERRVFVIQTLFLLEGKDLGCFCAPKRCHCDTYVRICQGIQPAPTFDSRNVLNNNLV